MGKRFTDTEKWRDEWWGSLPNDYRMIWLYLVDSCSIAGIWKKDFRGLNFNCNTNITEVEFLAVFGDRIVDRGNFFFIPKFLRFQCPKGLNSNKPAILSIVKELQLNNLSIMVNELFGNDYLIIKDKDKGIGKGKDKGKDKDTDKGTEKHPIELLMADEIWWEQEIVMKLKAKKERIDSWESWYINKFDWRKKDLSEMKKNLVNWIINPIEFGSPKQHQAAVGTFQA